MDAAGRQQSDRGNSPPVYSDFCLKPLKRIICRVHDGFKSTHKSIVSRVGANGGSSYLNYIKRMISSDYGFAPPQGQAGGGGGGGGHSGPDVMKCGVIFYFVSLDPLEITHSILKE